MESLDFVYDLLEKLQAQKMEYFLLTIRKGKNDEKADVFYNMEEEEAFMKVLSALQQIRGPEREPTDEELEAIEKSLEESLESSRREKKSTQTKKTAPKKTVKKPTKKPTKKSTKKSTKKPPKKK